MKLNIGKQNGPRIEMLPLIDVVFLLLVFFIYAMLSMAVHRALPVVLPASKTAKIDNITKIAVSITQEGYISIDKQSVTLANLSAILQKKSVPAKKKGVQIFADRHVDYQRLFSVLDQIKKAGISTISLQAERDGGE